MKLVGVTVVVLLASSVAHAGDQPEHRQMVYTLAFVAGFSPDEAKLIANGSWSMDMNDATVATHGKPDIVAALSFGKRLVDEPDFAAKLLNDDQALDSVILGEQGALGRIGPAALMHSLLKDPRRRTSDPIRPGLDAAYHEYIRRQVESLQDSGLGEPQIRQVRLLLAGQYLHQFVDSFVHPEDPMVGHALEGHGTDYAWMHPEEFKEAAFYTLKELRVLLTEIRPTDDRLEALRLDTEELQRQFCGRLVDAVSAGYFQDGEFREVLPEEVQRVTDSVERMMKEFLNGLGIESSFSIPEFRRCTYKMEGDGRARLLYEGSGDKIDVHVDGFVHWVVGNDKYEDLVNSVRATIRGYVRALDVAGQAGPALETATRSKLVRLLDSSRQEMTRAEGLKNKAQLQLQRAESIVAEAKQDPNDPDNRKILEDLGPKAIAKAAASIAEAEEALARAKQRLGLTERAIANLSSENAVDRIADVLLTWYGERIAQSVDDGFALEPSYLADEAELKRLGALVDRLCAVSFRPDNRLTVKVLSGNGVGWMAAASGATVYVNEDYLASGPSDEELLFILGRELAHAQLSHAAKQRLRRLWETVNADDGRGATDQQVTDLTGLGAGPPSRNEFAKDQEFEADLIAAQFALGAGGSVGSPGTELEFAL